MEGGCEGLEGGGGDTTEAKATWLCVGPTWQDIWISVLGQVDGGLCRVELGRVHTSKLCQILHKYKHQQ